MVINNWESAAKKKLTTGVSGLAFAEDHVLFKRFHSVDIPIVLFLDQVYFAEWASSNHLDYLKVVDADILRTVVWVSLAETLVGCLNSPSGVPIHIIGCSWIYVFVPISQRTLI